MPDPLRIDFNLDDRWSGLRRFLELFDPLINAQPGECWTLDLSSCQFLGPDAVAIIAAAYDRGKQRDQNPQVILPSEPPALVGFCEFVGLKHLLGIGPRPNPDHPDCETVPLKPFRVAIANAHAPVTTLIRRHFAELSDDVTDSIGVAINEVLNNTIDHAESPCGAYMCAKYFTNRRDVRVSIVDLGVGISTTLSRRYPEAQDSVRALEMVFEGNYSSQSRESNRGMGVSNLVALVRLRQGELIVVSGSAVGRFDRGQQEARFEKLPFDLPGTAAFFRMNVEDADD